MFKRIVSLLLCVCLLIPTVGVQLAFPSATAAAGSSQYVLAEIPSTIMGTKTAGAGAVMDGGIGYIFEPALDFTQMGYNAKTLGLQVDIYTAGDDGLVTALERGQVSGQFEFTSSGTCDVQEIAVDLGCLRYKRNTWVRQVVPLSSFVKTGTEEFDPTAVNYFRMYYSQPHNAALKGQKAVIKICKVRLVNMSVAAPSTTIDPIGDGTFVPDVPQWEAIDYGEGYDTSGAVVAGYNMLEYAKTHGMAWRDPAFDWAPVFNSLAEGLQMAGGGTLFIPAGEYNFYSEVTVPRGITVCGEWAAPEVDPTARGTLIKVYAGRGQANGRPFLTLQAHALVQNVTFWYPEQTVDNIVAYPPTVFMGQYTFVRNVTMINTYFGVQQKVGANCPNVANLYGTPLYKGMDMDMIVDISRMEEIHFAPDYWIRSGLSGAPESAEDAAALRDHLYTTATGVVLRRVDWSYMTFSDIRGYHTGLHLALSADVEGVSYPNGQCVGLYFGNCFTAIRVDGVQASTESMADITIKDCEYGLYLTRAAETEGTNKTSYNQRGSLRMVNMDISATAYAIWQNNGVHLSMLSSVIRQGAVVSSSGHLLIGETVFHTPAPQVVLQPGAFSATMLGNTATDGFSVENRANCTLNNSASSLDLQSTMYDSLTAEEAAPKEKKPATDTVYVANLDNSGNTDVTEGLQALLTQAGNNGGGLVYVPPGKYQVGGSLVVPTGVELRGAGDFGSMPAPVNTIFVIPETAEVSAAEQYTAPATVTLQTGAGIRAVTFHHPEQNREYKEVTVNGVQTYEFTFVPYPYTIRGAGSDVYVINVTSHNAWNGVDFATNRCDNHYVDYLAGHFFNRGIVVGNGSENGVIRNYQFNYNAILHAYHSTWGPWGCEPITSEMMEHFHLAMQRQFTNNAIVLQLGDVENQLVYNCFNYSCMYGVQFMKDAKTGKAPRGVRLFGHAVDYSTEAIRVEAGEDIQMLNIQVTAFNQKGSDITGEYAVTDKDIYDLHLTDTFTDEIVIWNFTEWAPNPTAAVRVDGGTLKIYNGALNNDKGEFFDINNKKMVTLVAFTTRHGDTPLLTTKDCTDYIKIVGGYYATKLKYMGTLIMWDMEYDFPTTNLSYMQSWSNTKPTDFTTYFTRNAGTVTKYNGSSATLTMPALLDGQLVTTLGDGTNRVASPTRLYVPTTVTAILPNAFAPETSIVFAGNADEWAAIDGSEVFTNVQTLGCDHADTALAFAIASTCLEAGYAGDTVCADCGRLLATGEKTAPHVTEQRGQIDPTCEEAGVAAGTWCTECEAYAAGGEVLPPHAKENRDEVPATCTENGALPGVWCTVCEIYLSGGEPTPPHKTEYYEQKDATCTAHGVTAGTWCTVCRKFIEGGQIIPAHATENRETVEATCTTAGHTAGVWCTVCEMYISGEEIPVHVTENRPRKNATCTEDGRLAGVWCTECEKYVSGGALMRAHAKEERPAIAPTQTEEGRTAGVWCTVCRKYVSGGEIIPRLPSALLGDVDGNEKVDSTDARLILQFAVGKIKENAINVDVADVDGNGEVNSTDARVVLQYAVGKIQKFPAE